MDQVDVVSVIFVALLVTKMVDTLRNWFDKRDTAPKGIWNLAAFGLGVASAFVVDAAGIAISGGADTVIATGMMIGATASGWHEVLDRLSPQYE